MMHRLTSNDHWKWDAPVPVDRVGALTSHANAGDGDDLAWIDMLAAGRGQITLGELFPGLPGGFEVAHLDCPLRPRNALRRAGVDTLAKLRQLTLADLFEVRNMGRLSVRELLRTLQTMAAGFDRSRHPDAAVATKSIGTRDDVDGVGESALAGRPERSGELFAAVATVATWNATIGRPEQPLGRLVEAAPDYVVSSWQFLMDRPPAEFVESIHQASAAELLEAVAARLDEVERETLAKRTFATEPEKLATLGERFGFTRERARQRETKALAAISAGIAADRALQGIAQVLAEQLRRVHPLDELLVLLPVLAESVPSLDCPVWRVFDRVDDRFEIRDGWCVLGSIDGAIKATMERLAATADDHGIAPLTGLFDAEVPQGARRAAAEEPAWLPAWLAYCGVETRESMALLKVRSLPERAATQLSLEARPLSTAELMEWAGQQRAETSLKNALAADDRFVRTDRDTWGLTEWGMRPYSGIRGEIGRILDELGGSVSLDTLVEMVVGRFRVAPLSVRAYASAYPFELDRGQVRRSSETFAPIGEVDLATTRRVYRADRGILARFEITDDHLRGSGFQMPTKLGHYLGLMPGESRQVRLRGEPWSLYWTGLQPAFGSVRSALLELEAVAGQVGYLCFASASDDDVELRLAELPVRGIERALVLVGRSGTAVDPQRELATAVGLPAGASWAAISRTLRDRGDGDVADCLAADASDASGWGCPELRPDASPAQPGE